MLDRVIPVYEVQNLFKRNFGVLTYKGQPSESLLLSWEGKWLLYALLGFKKICRFITIDLFYSLFKYLFFSTSQLRKPSSFCPREIKPFFSHLTDSDPEHCLGIFQIQKLRISPNPAPNVRFSQNLGAVLGQQFHIFRASLFHGFTFVMS